MRFYISILFLIILFSAACHKTEIVNPTLLPPADISTDKAVYKPGDAVTFTLTNSPDNPIKVSYKFLNEIIDEQTISSTSWTWMPPADDFRGYMAELYSTTNGSEQVIGTIAIDVSSDWKIFPRYGFLSKFPEMSSAAMDANIKRLSRHHINGLQFFDWAEKMHKPLAGTVSNPSYSWLDISNRPTFKPTVQGYITKAHEAGMKAMFNNLLNGALKDAEADGVNRKWYMFKDLIHTEKVIFDPGSSYKSPIYLINPTHTAWHDYMIAKNSDVYNVYQFDGFHVDQLGNPGKVYDYIGGRLPIEYGYATFISAMHYAHPGKRLEFKNVNGFGDITGAVDFIYNEVWSPNEKYSDIAKIVKQDQLAIYYNKKMVVAAYVNYDLGDNEGFFNTPSVLFADAVIFAFGGSHIELGEHLLCNEYFPNDNLQMKPDLQSKLVTYYDFLTAYENILRDGDEIYNAELTSADQKVNIHPWPPQLGGVACVGREMDNRHVFHLLNFTNATTLQWRDNTGIQVEPGVVENFELKFTSLEHAKKVWFASPDFEAGASREIEFEQDGLALSFTVPFLQYWSMIVVEY